MNDIIERVFIIQPIESDNYRILQEEAVALIESANAVYAGTVYQKIREINPSTYIGEGKIAEIREILTGLDVTVLFNGELSPSQTLNLSAALEGRKAATGNSRSSWLNSNIYILGSAEKARSFHDSEAGSGQEVREKHSLKPTAVISAPESTPLRKNLPSWNSVGQCLRNAEKRIMYFRSRSSVTQIQGNRPS